MSSIILGNLMHFCSYSNSYLIWSSTYFFVFCLSYKIMMNGGRGNYPYCFKVVTTFYISGYIYIFYMKMYKSDLPLGRSIVSLGFAIMRFCFWVINLYKSYKLWNMTDFISVAQVVLSYYSRYLESTIKINWKYVIFSK